MSLREWLIAIGTLVIIGIVIDGIRRMHRARKESIAISSGMGADRLDASPLDDDFNPELPNGGARTVSSATLEERGYVRREQPEADGHSAGWGALDDEDEPNEEILGGPRVVKPGRDSVKAATNPQADAVDTATPETDPVAADEVSEPVTMKDAGPAEVPHSDTNVQADTASRAADRARNGQPLAGANRPEAREVIVINVLAADGKAYKGPELKALFEACGLEHGDMDIYHRHEQADTISPVQFSVASAVEPGTFRPDEVAKLSTPGISFFMSLPGPDDALQAFDFMLETAQCVVRNLGGELKDERRSVMTPQTAEHCRQRIREFERKQRTPVH